MSSFRLRLTAFLLLASLTSAACAAASSDRSTSSPAPPPPPAPAAAARQAENVAPGAAPKAPANAASGSTATGAAAPQQAIPDPFRKIIYTAAIQLEVADVTQSQADVERLVQELGGYL